MWLTVAGYRLIWLVLYGCWFILSDECLRSVSTPAGLVPIPERVLKVTSAPTDGSVKELPEITIEGDQVDRLVLAGVITGAPKVTCSVTYTAAPICYNVVEP